jgi:hypothetical protein
VNSKTVEIQCRGADVLPLDAITDFQGTLKKRGKKEIDAIIKSIERFGFSFPFFIWNGTGDNYCLDGHGRIQALAEMRRQGVSLPMFPVVYVDAVDESEAKQKLLRLNSQYGQMTIDSVMEFTGGMEMQWDELALPAGALSFISEDDAEAEMPDLKTGDKEPFQQMTFTLADEQAGYVKQAIAEAIKSGMTESGINENRNGNALSWICERFLDGRD